jgi:hypothetical protein
VKKGKGIMETWAASKTASSAFLSHSARSVFEPADRVITSPEKTPSLSILVHKFESFPVMSTRPISIFIHRYLLTVFSVLT